MLIKVHMHVKFERGIVKSVSLMEQNANLHLTLKLEMFKVKAKDKSRNGKGSLRRMSM